MVNVWVSSDAGALDGSLKPLLLAGSIGLGASLQALAGAFLVHRYAGFPHYLSKDKHVLKFLLLGGPVSCVVSATVGVTSLLLAGSIPPASAFFSWWTWWVGDTIGVTIFAPLVLVLLQPPRELWWRVQVCVTAPLCLTFAAAVVVFLLASRWEADRVRLKFERSASAMTNALETDLDGYLEVLFSLERFYASSVEVNREEFNTFVKEALARRRGIQALEWIPVVPHSERTAYEDAARQAGYADFQFRERNELGDVVPAARREHYAPVYYVEPYEGNEVALGFDLASNPARRAAMHRARDLGTAAATERISLLQETGHQYGSLIFLPVYKNDMPRANVNDRRRHLEGYVIGVFRVGDVVRDAFEDFDQPGVKFQLSDETAAAGERLLDAGMVSAVENQEHSPGSGGEKSATELHWTKVMSIG